MDLNTYRSIDISKAETWKALCVQNSGKAYPLNSERKRKSFNTYPECSCLLFIGSILSLGECLNIALYP